MTPKEKSKAQLIREWLEQHKGNGQTFTAKELQKAIGFKENGPFSGAMDRLIRKGLAERVAPAKYRLTDRPTKVAGRPPSNGTTAPRLPELKERSETTKTFIEHLLQFVPDEVLIQEIRRRL